MENLRVPLQSSSTEGESGPKIRPKGVVDGQQVNIPVLPLVGLEGRRRLGEGVPPHKRGRIDQARATVYQKHWTSQSRKTMYGG
ncbi:hypothetical protein Tco_1300551 [Tanacetum coccineum]